LQLSKINSIPTISKALIAGNTNLLPSRISITPTNLKSRTATIDFWNKWSKKTFSIDIAGAIETSIEKAVKIVNTMVYCNRIQLLPVYR
jgi:hypothetical protein